MSTTTDKLALFKYDPSTDGAKTFNIQKALNENWDKLDDAVKEILITLANKAPDGFGLGIIDWNQAPQSDADKIPGTGWFLATNNVPSAGIWFIRQEYDGPSNNDALQTAWPQNLSAYYRGCLGQRYKISGTWSVWEWVNPPMILGTEYRTTERYLGKPVYVKAVNCGIVADGKQVEHGIVNMRDCIFAQGLRGGLPMPGIFNHNLSDPWSCYIVGVNATKITLACGSDAAGGSCVVLLKYTKNTD